MGRIKKAAGPKQEATVSPALSQFVSAAAKTPLFQLPSQIRSFPRSWPFPRGDLYHWIPLLNRFDTVLEQFNVEYGLHTGPQTQPFQRQLLMRGIPDDDKHSKTPVTSEDELETMGFGPEGDRELVEVILDFSRVLMENCGNRSLYSSSERLNDLLNTTSTSLLACTLRLATRLAQRYHASRQRGTGGMQHVNNALLASLYNINLDKIQKLALPFAKSNPPASVGPVTVATPTTANSAKGKERASPSHPRRPSSSASSQAGDMVSMAKDPTSPKGAPNGTAGDGAGRSMPETAWHNLGSVWLTYYLNEPVFTVESRRQGAQEGGTGPLPSAPTTPTPARRNSGFGSHQTSRPSRLSNSEETSTLQTTSAPTKPEVAPSSGIKTLEIPYTRISSTPLHEIMKSALPDVPQEYQYDLLSRVRTAYSLSSSVRTRREMLAIRILAITNLAYVYPETMFQQKVLQQDSDEPRRLQLTYQLAELVHPPGNGDSGIPRPLQTLALGTLEALAKQKSKAPDVCAALSINVNHGVLFYLTRKAVAELAVESSDTENLEEDEWREALFSLLSTLPTSTPRAGESMVAAGLVQILVEVLTLRTNKAERNHTKIINLFDSLVYQVRDAFQALANAKGLDILADLTAYEVESALQRADKGDGMPSEYRTQVIDYQIPYFQQQTLRWLFKFIYHMMQHNGANFDRLLRNLIDSPQLLSALRVVLSHAKVFGSNVWSGAVNILSSFIHNEPTSYAVIAEAGLSKGLLEAVTMKPVHMPEKMPEKPADDAEPSQNEHTQMSSDTESKRPVHHEDNDALLSQYSRSITDERIKERFKSLKPRTWRLAQGVLPATDAIATIPTAFGAICLNSAGMELFQASDALNSFFEIFESPEHVKCMASEGDLPTVLGRTFDELIRHHPPLKVPVLSSVMIMIARVCILCNSKAKDGYGAKLWLEGEDGQLLVAGGHDALIAEVNGLLGQQSTGPEESRVSDHEDVTMEMDISAGASSSDAVPDAKQAFVPQKILDEDSEKDGPNVPTYIMVALRFLYGFFENPSHCSAFVEAGGVQSVLDLATLPTLPYDFNNRTASQELARVVHMMAEQKAHLVLPPLVRRTQAAVDQLEPLASLQDGSALFAAVTQRGKSEISSQGQDVQELVKAKGTYFVKALVAVHTLCSILCETYSQPVFNHRSTHTPFSQVNLADMYAVLVKSLGRLHCACVWEEITLQRSVPDSWRDATRIKGYGLGSQEADEILGLLNHVHVGSEPTETTNAVAETDGSGQGDSDHNPPKDSNSNVMRDRDTAAFKNVQTLRYLLSQVPSSITPFFQGLGKILIAKRRSDSYQRQNAYMVADALAGASISQLRFQAAANSVSVQDRYSYWIVALTSLSQFLVERTSDLSPVTLTVSLTGCKAGPLERPHAQCLTLVLQSFKNQGGLDALKDILMVFFDEVKSSGAIVEDAISKDVSGRLAAAYGGIKIILTLYSQITNPKYIIEASQTAVMSDRDREKADYFSPAQFLVELRMAVLPVVRTIWESEFVDSASSSIVKCLIEILRTILEGDHEHGAFKRSEKVPARTKAAPKHFTIPSDRVSTLKEKGYSEELAREALYRCNNNLSAAEEYCNGQYDPALRNPIPSYENPSSPPRSRSSPARRDSEATLPDITNGAESTQQTTVQPPMTEGENDAGSNPHVELQEASSEDVPTESSPPPPAPGVPQETNHAGGDELLPMSIDNLLNLIQIPSVDVPSVDSTTSPNVVTQPSHSTNEAAMSKMPETVTIDDLDSERSEIRLCLIDRCLDVLNVHSDVTFELADLITAAVARATDPASMRREIGETLVQSLISLQLDEDSRPEGKKIAAYANLLALVLQDRDFYEAALDELKDNFATLLGFIKVFPDQAVEASSPWIGQILLIIEKMLAEDAQPQQIKWTPPSNDETSSATPIADLEDPAITLTDKTQLFDAIVEVLPRIGKDESLALSVVRVLVILTRHRQLAVRLGEKRNMQRLFVMVKQLAGVTNERLQSAFMLVLRHVIEDEDTIRQIMRSEIVASFKARPTRQTDTTGYVRQLYHLVLRDPQIFIEVTNEKLKLQRFDTNQRPQFLTLKAEVEYESLSSGASQDAATVAEAASATPLQSQERDVQTLPEQQVAANNEGTKSVELKTPVVEHPDGVIHYLLCELLSYKDVEDRDPSSNVKDTPQTPKSSAQGDIDMTNGYATPMPAPSTPAGPAENKDVKKDEFKADQHPVYIYRCFLLQCLTELLSSYNRTKIEFINFSRKADPQAVTPSKPRSGVLNYLLNAVIPLGTLEHEESLSFRKKSAASSWAMSAIVALCSRTGEQGDEKSRNAADNVDEPDLLFVRKFVLEHALKAYKDANAATEALDVKYARMLCIADLFNQMLTSRPYQGGTSTTMEVNAVPQKEIAKIMYEKNFISALTSSIADIDLNFPGSKRVVKYILRPLKQLTRAAITLSETSSITTTSGHTDDDEISTASSVSEMDDEREETPDLFRNSTLGMFEPGREEESSSDSSEGDEEMYDDEYGEEMDYEEEIPGDSGDVISDEDEEIDGAGHMEGLPGDVGMDVEVVIDEDDDDGPTDEDDEDDDDSEDMEDGDEIEIIDDIQDDEEDQSLAEGEEDEWQSEVDEGDGYEVADDAEHDLSQDPDRLDIVQAIEGEAQSVLERMGRAELEMELGDDGEYMDDVVHDEEEDEEDEEDTEDQDLMYEPDFEVNFDTYFDPGEEEHGMPNMPWDWDADEPPPPMPRGHHHHHHHRLPSPWTIFPGGPPDRGIGIPTYRSHRPVGPARGTDDGTNPLLQRVSRNGGGPGVGRGIRSGAGAYLALSDWVHAMEPGHPSRGLFPGDSPVSFMNNIISAIGQGGPFGPLGHRHGLHLHVAGGSRDLLPRELQAMLGLRRSQPDTSRPSRDDPAQAIQFTPMGTTIRWQEEARLLYGNSYAEKTQRLVNSLLRVLVPPAIEEEKIRKEKAAEELRKQKEEREKKLEEERTAKEKLEKEAQEKLEKEQREAAETAEAAARTQAEEQARAAADGEEPVQEEAMEGIERTQPDSPHPPASEAAEAPAVEAGVTEEASEPAARVHTTIRGRELDITGMDIDPEYLDALPEELREEVLMHQLAEQRSQAAAAGEEPTDISREFLEALPPDIREELLQQEAQDRRRREREEHRRRAAANAGTPAARGEEMDPASFLASLDPTLRQAVLMEQDDEVLAHLPQAIAAEARALGGDRRLHQFMDMPRINRNRGLDRGDRGAQQANKKPQRKQIVQMLDKAGVATLLRLMFIPQQGSARQCLNSILHDVCENRQNRAEVVSLLLSILQDGSADINAVDRSFQQLSLRAKQPTAQKTPQPKRTLSGLTPPQANTEMTPLMVVQQCLSALVFLTQYNPHLPSFFLTEHETSGGLKGKTSRKGKGKESKAQKYALNALLSLLDRKIIMESSNCMELLSTLLNSVTHPLTMLLKKDKEKVGASSEKGNEAAGPSAEAATTEQTGNDATLGSAETQDQNEDTNMAEGAPPAEATTADQTQVVESVNEQSASGVEPSSSVPKPENATGPTEEDKTTKQRTLLPPVVPEYNLRLVINILAARECSAKTFRDTLSTINNLSAIPEAKAVFGKELIKQAQELAESILNDLDDLVTQIKEAGAASDIQGMALARFSLASSDQAKLLRVLTALDYLFDSKRHAGRTSSASSATDVRDESSQVNDNLLTTLYENSTFGPLWTKLSECLSTIRSRDNMLNVATILLPLIEALMVVCKNTTLKDALLVKVQKEFAVTSPPPESRMESIFFNFTEEHRKILNDLVRHNPKLMSGTFSLLVKNPKVLEFDNKRNYFSRRLHSRGTEARHPQPPLQLSNVRRDQVFLDSFKSLYFKSPEEMKYGKLSIRFHGEEGVDAGGVTREWFQVLSRQMFNPDYALFTPVAADRTTFHPNRLSSVNPEHFMFFKFIGRVIGKALYEGRVLDCHFSRAVYKRILGKTVSIKDMETLDLEYYKSLVWMLENDITDVITENFSLETEAFGETQVIDLIENGRNIPVTEENKQEYVQLVVEYRLTGSVHEQLDEFLKGFHDIVPAELISIFNEQELELLISGLPDIDVDDWKNNTEYHNYSASSSQIQWFWRAVRSFDKEERAKLLQFVTGTSKVPLNGFKELEGMNGFSRFNIHRDYGNKDRLPSSHTCFNQLDLPEYESYEALRQQVYTAITAGSEYFGFA